MVPTIIDAEWLYEQAKFWSLAGGVLWAVFKGYQWVKDIRDKDLIGLQTHITTMNSELSKQTEAISSGFTSLQGSTTRELQELRSDFRTFYTSPDPIMVPVRARKKTRKRASVTARKRAKVKKPL